MNINKILFFLTISFFMIFIFIYCEDNQSESNLKNNNQTGNDNISIENEMNHQSDQSNNDKTQETDIDNTNQMENDKSKIEINDFEKTNPENLIKVDYDNKKYYLRKAGNFYTMETPESELPPENHYIVYFDKDGKRIKEEEINDGDVTYTLIRKYYDTGELYIRAEYGENQTPKNITVYNINSIVIRKEVYIRGKLTFVTYFDDLGKKIRDENYSNGIIRNAVNYTGEVVTKEEIYNQNGEPDGWWVYRNIDALKTKEELYHNGELQEYIIYKYDQSENKILEERFINDYMVEFFTYEYTQDYIIQERYVLDESDPEKKKYLLMDRIQFER